MSSVTTLSRSKFYKIIGVPELKENGFTHQLERHDMKIRPTPVSAETKNTPYPDSLRVRISGIFSARPFENENRTSEVGHD